MSRGVERVAALLPAYELERELGRGSWGVVYGGRHRGLDRPVAVKLLPPAFSADAEVRERFVVEARLLARLDHPHVVRVFDYLEVDNMCLLIMEFMSGGTLGDRVAAGGLTSEQAVAIAMAACAGLQHAHAAGVLHRDIKPDNLMFTESGLLKVTDFGIAKVVAGGARMTSTGMVLGTPAYMAPEQTVAAALGPHTDVYAVAAVLYEMLSGRLPFTEHADTLTVMYERSHSEPLSLDEVRPDLPAPVVEAVMSGLARKPADRCTSAGAFLLALDTAAVMAWGHDWLDRTGVLLQVPLDDGSRRSARLKTQAAPAPPTQPTPIADPPASARAPEVTAPTPTAPVPAPSPAPAAAGSLGLAGVPAAAGPQGGSRRGLFAAVAAVAVVVLGAAGFALAGGGSGGSATTTSSTTTSSTSATSDTSATTGSTTPVDPGMSLTVQRDADGFVFTAQSTRGCPKPADTTAEVVAVVRLPELGVQGHAADTNADGQWIFDASTRADLAGKTITMTAECGVKVPGSDDIQSYTDKSFYGTATITVPTSA